MEKPLFAILMGNDFTVFDSNTFSHRSWSFLLNKSRQCMPRISHKLAPTVHILERADEGKAILPKRL